MTDALLHALDDALRAVECGETAESVLARYPQLAADLRPMLKMAAAAGVGQPPAAVPAAAESASRARLLARAAELRAAGAPGRGERGPRFLGSLRMPSALRAATILGVFLAGFLAGTFGAVSASAGSVPGDALYGLKRTVESTQLLFASEQASRARLEQQFDQRRLHELQAVTEQHRTVRVDFAGSLKAINGQRWTVADVSVVVNDATRITGEPVIGQIVRVWGETQADGAVLAARVEAGAAATPPSKLVGTATPGPSAPGGVATSPVPPAPSLTPGAVLADEVEFTGRVESIGPAAWQIGGQIVHITAETDIRGAPQLGQTVEVRARRMADGRLVAYRIEVDSSGPGPAGATPGPTVIGDDGDDDDDDQATAPAGSVTPTAGGATATDDDDGSSGQGSGPAPSATAGPVETDDDDGSDGSGESASMPTPEPTDFDGLLQARNSSTWTVAGQTVIVTSDTEIRGDLRVGQHVRVRGLRYGDGRILAERIEAAN